MRRRQVTGDDWLSRLKLSRGEHYGPQDGACLMEAVAYLAGEPWSDAPQCASPVLAAFLRTWNDVLGDRDRQRLTRFVPRLVGSRGSPAREAARADLALTWFRDIARRLPPGDRGMIPVLAAVESARHDAHGGPLSLDLTPAGRVPGWVLEAVDGLVGGMLAVTETPAPPPSAESIPRETPAPRARPSFAPRERHRTVRQAEHERRA